MIYINAGERGLNAGLEKPRWMRRIRLKDVSLKNAIKVAKFAAPIAASFIPVGGGTTSGLLSKILKNKDGNTSFVGRIADKATKLSKTPLGSVVTKNLKSTINKTAKPQLKTVSELKSASVATSSSQTNTQKTAVQNNEPVGELTPVAPATELSQTSKKDNTTLYAVGAVAVLGGIYLATKSSK